MSLGTTASIRLLYSSLMDSTKPQPSARALVAAFWKGRGIPVTDSLSVSLVADVPLDRQHAVYAFGSGRLDLRRGGQFWPLTLENAEFELYTISPVDEGVAPIGILSMYNSAGIIESCGWAGSASYSLKVKSGGEIGLYSRRRPVEVVSSLGPLEFSYKVKEGFLRFELEGLQAQEVRVLY